MAGHAVGPLLRERHHRRDPGKPAKGYVAPLARYAVNERRRARESAVWSAPRRGRIRSAGRSATAGLLGGYEKGLKAGRARGKKVMCAVTVEVRGRGSGRLRLAILEDASKPSLSALVSATTERGAIVHTDGWKGYNGLTELGYEHSPLSQGPEPVGEEPYLPRAHRAISNLKAWLHGTHRRASQQHLQAYLDEFVFRHNRRGNPHAAFQTLLGLSARHEPVSYRQVIDEAA